MQAVLIFRDISVPDMVYLLVVFFWLTEWSK